MNKIKPHNHSKSSEPAQPHEGKARKGFASMTPDRRREIAQKGGVAVSSNAKHMSEIGRKGGLANSKDTEYMAKIGRRGGLSISEDKDHMAEIGQMGGETTQEKRKMEP